MVEILIRHSGPILSTTSMFSIIGTKTHEWTLYRFCPIELIELIEL